MLDSESGTFDDARLQSCGSNSNCTVTGLSVARGRGRNHFFPIMHHEAFSVSGCEIMVSISPAMNPTDFHNAVNGWLGGVDLGKLTPPNPELVVMLVQKVLFPGKHFSL